MLVRNAEVITKKKKLKDFDILASEGEKMVLGRTAI